MVQEADAAGVMAEVSDHPVSKFLRDYMGATGLNQQGVAWKLDTSVAVVNQLLRDANPTYETLNKIVENLGADPRLLFPSWAQTRAKK